MYVTAWEDYAGGWKSVDDELRRIVRRHGWNSWQNVFTKVVFVDGIYRAGLPRVLGRDATKSVASVLVGSKAIAQSIEGLRRHHGQLTEAAVRDVLEAHGQLLAAVTSAGGIDAKSARSFASKFLHFHDAVVPIIDSRTAETRARFLTWKGAPRELRQAGMDWPRPVGCDPQYRWHVIRVALLWKHLSALGPSAKVTVKGLDHMLLRG
ncbi:MAG: hypothetical protein M0Z69_12000 [Actinomycetota bacterium]|nr:hypothetical protein [Actinomycetota bacterium]